MSLFSKSWKWIPPDHKGLKELCQLSSTDCLGRPISYVPFQFNFGILVLFPSGSGGTWTLLVKAERQLREMHSNMGDIHSSVPHPQFLLIETGSLYLRRLVISSCNKSINCQVSFGMRSQLSFLLHCKVCAAGHICNAIFRNQVEVNERLMRFLQTILC